MRGTEKDISRVPDCQNVPKSVNFALNLTEFPVKATRYWKRATFACPHGLLSHVPLDNNHLIVSDCVANDALKTKVSCKIQRRRASVLGPATTEFIQSRHVAIDVFGAQLQLVVPSTPFSLLHSLRHFCMPDKHRGTI